MKTAPENVREEGRHWSRLGSLSCLATGDRGKATRCAPRHPSVVAGLLYPMPVSPSLVCLSKEHAQVPGLTYADRGVCGCALRGHSEPAALCSFLLALCACLDVQCGRLGGAQKEPLPLRTWWGRWRQIWIVTSIKVGAKQLPGGTTTSLCWSRFPLSSGAQWENAWRIYTRNIPARNLKWVNKNVVSGILLNVKTCPLFLKKNHLF